MEISERSFEVEWMVEHIATSSNRKNYCSDWCACFVDSLDDRGRDECGDVLRRRLFASESYEDTQRRASCRTVATVGSAAA